MNKFDVMTKYRSYLYFHLFADTFKTLMKLNICTKPLEEAYGHIFLRGAGLNLPE